MPTSFTSTGTPADSGAPYTAFTELEAVNVMLEVIGEAPVTVISSAVPESVIAQNLLNRTSREVQSPGFSFNTDTDYTIALDVDNKVPIPENVLHVDGYYTTNDYVQRGAFLYDRYTRLYTFTTAPKLKVVWFLPFTDLPSHARELITIIAARRFQKRMLGSNSIDKFTEEDESRSRALFMTVEMDSEDNNMLQGPNQWRIGLNRR
jgi:hypothetical protein